MNWIKVAPEPRMIKFSGAHMDLQVFVGYSYYAVPP